MLAPVVVLRHREAPPSRRPDYRPSISGAEALAELQRCAHTQFDPVVVDALSELLGVERGQSYALGLAVA